MYGLTRAILNGLKLLVLAQYTRVCVCSGQKHCEQALHTINNDMENV